MNATNLRLGFRLIAKQPLFSGVAILAIALGIGAVTSAFSIFNSILLRPLPLIADQERLVAVMQTLRKEPDGNMGLCYPDYRELKRQSQTLEGVIGVQQRTFILTDGETPERLLGCSISAGAFSLLGVQPVLGRDLLPAEEAPNSPMVVLLAHDVWQRRYAGDTNILRRPIHISGTPVTVVGVMPPGWRYPEQADIWMPLRQHPEHDKRGTYYLETVGRLKPGVSIQEARAELETIAQRLGKEFPDTNAEVAFRLEPLRRWMTHDTHLMLDLMLGAVVFVHLIACANVANLLLARGSRRLREVALRMALGASRAQIVGQLLTESLVLGVIGGALGLLLAVWGTDLMAASIPREVPFWVRMGLDWRVLSLAAIAAVGSALLFGAAPAWQLANPRIVEQLKEGGRGSSEGLRHARLRHGLVVGEIALALVLLVGAGLMLRSLWKTRSLDPGFDPKHVLTFRVGLPPAHYTNSTDYIRFFEDVTRRLAALPGVESAGAMSYLPATGQNNIQTVEFEGRPKPRLHEAPRLRASVLTPGALTAMRIPILRGRDFLESDTTNTLNVALVDARFARLHFPGVDAVGRRFRPLSPKEEKPEPWITIVGVVGDIRTRFSGEPELPAMYLPAPQAPEAFMSYVLRVRGDPASYESRAQAEVFAVNRDIPIYYPMPMTAVIARATWDKRFFGGIFTFFALLALFLAALGIYGVMAYTVGQRTQEIGVRMALGAQPGDVIRMVVRNGAKQLAMGLAFGLAGAFVLARSLEGTLYGIRPHDPPVFGLVPVLLGVVALTACYLPARRAARVSPVVALRYE
jgi:putative ABC transport system permease protein